jgi:hypothetical protein
MDAFIYLPPGSAVSGLDQIEDLLDGALGESGEVTGSGSGVRGINFDVEIWDDALTPERVVALIRQALATMALPASGKVVINEEEYPLVSS